MSDEFRADSEAGPEIVCRVEPEAQPAQLAISKTQSGTNDGRDCRIVITYSAKTPEYPTMQAPMQDACGQAPEVAIAVALAALLRGALVPTAPMPK